MYELSFYTEMFPILTSPPRKLEKTLDQLKIENEEKQKIKNIYQALMKSDERIHCIN